MARQLQTKGNSGAAEGRAAVAAWDAGAYAMDLRGSFALVLPFLRGRCLDIGCADGKHLAALPLGARGLDIVPANVDACRRQGLNAEIADCNHRLPFVPGSFDAVLMSHVLEHLDAPIQALRETHRVLRPGGVLVLGLPTETAVPGLRRRWDYFGHEGHLYSFSVDNIRRLLAISGFRPAAVRFQVPGIDRLRLAFLHHSVNWLPAAWLEPWCPAYWMVAERDGGDRS